MKLIARSHHYWETTYWETTCFIVVFLDSRDLCYKIATQRKKKNNKKAREQSWKKERARQQLHKAAGVASGYSVKKLPSCSLLLTGWLRQPTCDALAWGDDSRQACMAETSHLFSMKKQ